MAVFDTTFEQTGPVGTDLANKLDTFIRQDTKAAINERIALEHYDLVSGVADDTAAGGQGRHKPGYVGVFLRDTKANILAISGAGIGAVGLANDTGELIVNGSSGWEVVQFGTGTIYASDAEAVAGLLEDVAINPKQLLAQSPLGYGIVPVLMASELKASGADGGSSTASTWVKRLIDEIAVNTITSASITSGVITLPAGTYEIRAHATWAYGSNTGYHQIRLRDTDAGTTLALGSNAGTTKGDQSNPDASDSFLQERFVLTAETDMEIQHWTNASSTFGLANSNGENENYGSLHILQIITG